jgi:hypothetical protein
MWSKLKAWFYHSETIAWARIQALIGIAAQVLTFVDPQMVVAVIPVEYARYASLFLLLNGLATEWLRRRGDPEMKK